MPTQAPNSRRPVNENSDWTARFRTASAWRSAKVTLWTMTCGALLLLSSLTQRTEAQQEVKPDSAPRLSTASADEMPSTPVVSEPESVHVETAAKQDSLSQDSASNKLVVSSPSPSSSSSQHSPNDLNLTNAAPVASVGGAEKKPSAPLAPQAVSAPTIKIRVVADGKEQTENVAVTPKLTVGQALAAMGISLAAIDRVMPEATALAYNGMSVRVVRIKNRIEKKRVAIAPEVRYQPTTAIKPGAKKTVVQPKSGYYEIAERIWTRDGKETKREFVSRRLAQQPQHKVIALGVKPNLMPNVIKPHRRYAKALSARGGSPRDRLMGGNGAPPEIAPANPNTFRAIKSLKVETTGYAAGRAGGAISNWTATGVRCTYGAVAVDPRLIPLGTKMYIEGYGYAFACDTGGAIKGHHIDLAFDSPRDAFRHGRRRTTVWILAP